MQTFKAGIFTAYAIILLTPYLGIELQHDISYRSESFIHHPSDNCRYKIVSSFQDVITCFRPESNLLLASLMKSFKI